MLTASDEWSGHVPTSLYFFSSNELGDAGCSSGITVIDEISVSVIDDLPENS